MTVEMLNEDVVDSDVEDSVLLQKAVIANREKADLFGKPGRYRKLDQ